MGNITQKTAQAFIDGRDMRESSTSVHYDSDTDTRRLYLRGNLIAEQAGDALRVTLAGQPTPTTREHINGLLEALNINKRVYQQKHAQYIGSTIAETAVEITAYEWIRL